MKVAIPLDSNGRFSPYFGRSSRFEAFEVDRLQRTVRRRLIVVPQSSIPCQWPRLLRAAGVSLLIVHRIGTKAEQRMAEHEIAVLTGAPKEKPDDLIATWLAGNLPEEPTGCHRHGARRFRHSSHSETS